jgi:hypothetical protein
VSNLSHEQRVALVERARSELPLTQQAELLNVSRSSLYYQPREPSAEEIAIKHRIDEIYSFVVWRLSNCRSVCVFGMNTIIFTTHTINIHYPIRQLMLEYVCKDHLLT